MIPVLLARRGQIGEVLRNTEIPARSSFFAAIAAISLATVYLAWQAISRGFAHLHGPGDISAFAVQYVRLFSGTTIYEFIAGTNSAASDASSYDWLPTACDLVFAAVGAVALAGMAQRIKHKPTAGDRRWSGAGW